MKDFFQNNEISVIIKTKDLADFADTLIQRTKNEINSQIQQAKEERYLTEKQVQEMLSVTHSTLWHWNKKGYLKTVKVGNKNRYKYSDVLNLLNQKQI